MPETPLQIAERSFAEQVKRIAKQLALIEKLGADGHPTKTAVEILEQMLRVLWSIEKKLRAMRATAIRAPPLRDPGRVRRGS